MMKYLLLLVAALFCNSAFSMDDKYKLSFGALHTIDKNYDQLTVDLGNIIKPLDPNSAVNVDDSHIGYQVNIERNLIENLSIQLRYTDNGRFRSKLTTDFAVLEQSANIESLGLGLLGTIKLPMALALVARVGGDRIKIKQCGALTAAGVAFVNQCEKQYKWASSIGLSLSKELIKNTVLEVGFERRDISKLKPSFGFSSYQNTYSMSLGYRF